MTTLFAIYVIGAIFVFAGSLIWAANTHESDEKHTSLVIVNTILWPLLVTGFVTWCCIAGIKYHIRAFKSHMPK